MTETNPVFNLLIDELPFDVNCLPPSACLVGGAVRDALLNSQRDYLDLDFVLAKSAIETARKIAKQYQAGFVILDETRQIARVVFKQGTVDFAQQEGATLEKDLQRRDFTINAIAYNFHQKNLIDPLGGLQDLRTKTLRMISPQNLQDDPLRLLRAYRQAAQLRFTIDPKTKQTIGQLAPLITRVAAERVQAEFNYLLGNSQGSYWLNEVEKDGLLTPWFPKVNQSKLAQLHHIDKSVRWLQTKLNNQEFQAFLKLKPSQKFNQSSLVQQSKLASLVSSVTQEAEKELLKLKYSRHDIKTVVKALNYLPWLQQNQGEIGLRQLYFFFLEVGDVFCVIAILGLATGIESENLLELINRYLDPHDPVAHPHSLVTGHDLIKELNLKPSPQLGKLLTELQIAQIEQKISTKEEALQFAKLYGESVPKMNDNK